MAIDIGTLGLPKAVIGSSGEPRRPPRITDEQAKQMLDSARENGSVQDLLEVSGVDQKQVADMAQRAGDSVHYISNYSASAFFSREVPDQTESGGYTVSGAHFTPGELAQARQVLQTAADSISAGPGRNTNLDYRNYAQMAIAENAVASYAAKSGLNAEQQKAVTGAMREYNEGLLKMQEDLLGARPAGEGSYYGPPHVLSQAEADMLNSFKADLSRLTGKQFRMSRAGDSGGYDQIAANGPLISRITSLFADADLTARSGMEKALQSYAELVRPAYLAQGVAQADMGRVLGNDVDSLRSLFTAVVNSGHSRVDVSW